MSRGGSQTVRSATIGECGTGTASFDECHEGGRKRDESEDDAWAAGCRAGVVSRKRMDRDSPKSADATADFGLIVTWMVTNLATIAPG